MPNNQTDLKEELKTKLKELFQFENQDLNFGIYRIMNYKRIVIERFIEEKLINTKSEFESHNILFQEDHNYIEKIFSKTNLLNLHT